MTIALSDVFKSSVDQSFRALTVFLEKAKARAAEIEAEDSAFLDHRLAPDMHPMKWQVQMITEFAVRGAARLSGVDGDSLPEVPFEGDTFDALIKRVVDCAKTVADTDDGVLDNAVDMQISMPVGPDQTMDLDGKTYAINFFLPNLNFHVTTAYNLLRMQGVPLGKRDFMGM